MSGLERTFEEVELISRREALARLVSFSALLGTGLSSAVLFSGCGGGNGLTPPEPPQRLWPVNIPQELTEQLESFSSTVDEFASFTAGSSEANQRFDDVLRVAGRSDSQNPVRPHVKLMYSAFANRVVYERLCRAMYSLSKVGYIADNVSVQNNLTQGASLSNPQWVAATMGQVYCLLTISGALMQIQQSLGIHRLKDWVLSKSDSTERSIAYALAAAAFNRWAEFHAQRCRLSPAEFMLDISSNMDAGRIESELGRISGILEALPLSPSYCPPTGRSDGAGYYSDGQLINLWDFASGVFQDAIIDYFDPQRIRISSTYEYYEFMLRSSNFEYIFSSERIRILIENQKIPFLTALARQIPQEIVESLIRNTAVELLTPYGNIGQIVDSMVDLFSSARAFMFAISLASGTTLLGVSAGLVLQILAGVSLVQAIEQLAQLLPEFRGFLQSLLSFAEYLDRNKPTAHYRNVRPKTIGRYILCLILKSRGLGRYTITVPSPHASLPNVLRLGNMDLSASAELLLGKPNSRYPRTYQQVQTAAANMMSDYLQRNSQVTAPRIDGNRMSYVASNFAMLRRRSPDESEVEIPAITEADLMQIAPGFIPRRDEGVDLDSLTELPSLDRISPIGIGGKINVR